MNFFINEQEVEFQPKQTVLQAAIKSGVYIPYFCWHPQLSMSGNCRICFVEIVSERGNIIKPACATEITEGMKILTNSEKVILHRKRVMEMLLLNHPVDCGICDKAGECLLQDYHFAHHGSPTQSLESKAHDSKYHNLSERIILDNERCILCSRCVRFTQEISKSNGLGIIGRGDHSLIREAPDNSFASDAYSDNVIDLCPVGALLSKKFMYQSRVWYIAPTKSICPGCSNGCEVKIWHRKDSWKLNAVSTEKNQKIERVTPFYQNVENRPSNLQIAKDTSTALPEGKSPWICNIGRDLAKFYDKTRGLYPICKGKEINFSEAINKTIELVNSAKSPTMLVSNWASNEELKLINNLPKISKVFFNERDCAEGEVSSDELLIKSDKNPNSKGVHKYINNIANKIPKNCDLLIVFSLLGENFDFTTIQSQLASGAKLILFTPYLRAENGFADVYIPISLPTERNGSWINDAGEENKFLQCFDKPKNVYDFSEIVINISTQII